MPLETLGLLAGGAGGESRANPLKEGVPLSGRPIRTTFTLVLIQFAECIDHLVSQAKLLLPPPLFVLLPLRRSNMRRDKYLIKGLTDGKSLCRRHSAELFYVVGSYHPFIGGPVVLRGVKHPYMIFITSKGR